MHNRVAKGEVLQGRHSIFLKPREEPRRASSVKREELPSSELEQLLQNVTADFRPRGELSLSG